MECTPFDPLPVKDVKVFYGYFTCSPRACSIGTYLIKGTQQQTIGIKRDFKRFKTGEKATAFDAAEIMLARPPFA